MIIPAEVELAATMLLRMISKHCLGLIVQAENDSLCSLYASILVKMPSQLLETQKANWFLQLSRSQHHHHMGTERARDIGYPGSVHCDPEKSRMQLGAWCSDRGTARVCLGSAEWVFSLFSSHRLSHRLSHRALVCTMRTRAWHWWGCRPCRRCCATADSMSTWPRCCNIASWVCPRCRRLSPLWTAPQQATTLTVSPSSSGY